MDRILVYTVNDVDAVWCYCSTFCSFCLSKNLQYCDGTRRQSRYWAYVTICPTHRCLMSIPLMLRRRSYTPFISGTHVMQTQQKNNKQEERINEIYLHKILYEMKFHMKWSRPIHNSSGGVRLGPGRHNSPVLSHAPLLWRHVLLHPERPQLTLEYLKNNLTFRFSCWGTSFPQTLWHHHYQSRSRHRRRRLSDSRPVIWT